MGTTRFTTPFCVKDPSSGNDLFCVNENGFYGNLSTAAKTTDYTITASDHFITADASSSQITITLPASPNAGEIYRIKKINITGSNVVVSGNSNTIDGVSSQTLTGTGMPSITVIYKSEWHII